MEVVDRAMHRLVEDLQASGVAPTTVLGVVAGSTWLELLVDRPASPPSPWTTSGQGFRWRIGTNQLPAGHRPESAPLPALVPIGRAVDDGADILLNLEAAGVLWVTGDPERAAGVVRALATAMSGLTWAHAMTLIVVGFGGELSAVDRVRSVDKLTDVLDELHSTVDVMGGLMGGSDPFLARIQRRAGDGWAPTVVCCLGPLDPADRGVLIQLSRPGSGVVAVLAGALEPTPPAGAGAWVMDVDSSPMTVQPLRLSVDPTVLDAADLDRIGQLYRLANDAGGAGRDDPPYDRLPISAHHHEVAATHRGDMTGPSSTDGEGRTGSYVAGTEDHDDNGHGPPARGAAGASPDGGAVQPSLPEPGGAEPATPASATPASATPASATPASATPASATPASATPASATPASATPASATPASATPARSVPREPPPSVLVRVLGTVEIEGSAVFKRAKSRELAVYLAMHPNGVGEAELDEALWPSRDARLVSASTRDSTVSVARTALGGPTRLLPAQGHGREKRYQLSEAVATDWATFCALHRSARADRKPEALCEGLELVRGRPFEGVIAARSYGWVHTEGHARHIEAEVADAADLAAAILLGDGRPIDARWAARRGLLADPYIERLWVRLMEAADRLGDSQEIERILDEMDAVLELDGDFSGLHPNTIAVYERLSRHHRLTP